MVLFQLKNDPHKVHQTVRFTLFIQSIEGQTNIVYVYGTKHNIHVTTGVHLVCCFYFIVC